MKSTKLMFIVGLMVCFIVSANTPNVCAFGLGDLTKKSGGDASDVDWSSLAEQSTTALVSLYKGQALLSEAVADLADVVGDKDEAAKQRGLVEKLKECGSSSCPEFAEVQESDEELTKSTLKKIEELDSLTEEQKAQSTVAMTKYLSGGVLYAKGANDVKTLSEQAIDAPMMKKTKFVGLIKAAPVAVNGASSLLQSAPTLFKLATAKDIKYPEEQKDEMMDMLTM